MSKKNVARVLKKERNILNFPSEERLAKIPRFHETDDVPLEDTVMHLHFFFGAFDWYVAEYDGEDLFWGFGCQNGSPQTADWGLLSIETLEQFETTIPVMDNEAGTVYRVMKVECESEKTWKVRKASEIEVIRKANRWDHDET